MTPSLDLFWFFVASGLAVNGLTMLSRVAAQCLVILFEKKP